MRTKLSTCLKKATYRGEDEAIEAILRSGLDLRMYRCDRCRLYHLTSRRKGKRLPRRLG